MLHLPPALVRVLVVETIALPVIYEVPQRLRRVCMRHDAP
jgi:hypothetical protein